MAPADPGVGLTYLEWDRHRDWFKSYYAKLEQLLLQTAEEMLAQKSES